MENREEGLLADRRVVGEVLGGNTNAFAAVIRDTEKLVAGILFQMVADREEHKDISQEIYLKAFHKLGSFRFESRLSTWIAQIAFNTCRSHLEKKKSVPLAVSRCADPGKAGAFSTQAGGELSHNDTEQSIDSRELSALLEALVEKLPPLSKTLITLFHREELSYAEIALITSLPEGTVKSYLFRARKELKDNLIRKNKNEKLWPVTTSAK